MPGSQLGVKRLSGPTSPLYSCSSSLGMACDFDQSPQNFGLTTGITPILGELRINDTAVLSPSTSFKCDYYDGPACPELPAPVDDRLFLVNDRPPSPLLPLEGLGLVGVTSLTSPVPPSFCHLFPMRGQGCISTLVDEVPAVRGSPYYDRSRLLILEILANTYQKTLVSELKDEDAQQMVDFLDVVLRDRGILASDEGKSIWSLLCKLAKSAQVFPRCYELKGINCDPIPQAGGAFADVYKGEYNGQAICLKVVRIFQRRNNAKRLRTHAKELTLWAHLLHQNILPFYGVYTYTPGQTEIERIGLVSPWMSCGNVRDYLAEHPETSRMPLVSDIIAGLSYLHGLMIVHGDLKAQNVLVSDEGRALITDFGISRFAIITSKQATSQISNGTTRWIAPELVASDGDDDIVPTKECDIWSFSCLCYEVFTRQVPFYQYQSDYQVISALQKGNEIPLRPVLKDKRDGIDDHMWTLMVKCWDYVPQNRPSCEEIHQFIANPEFTDHCPTASTRVRSRYALQSKAKSEGEIDYERVYNLLRVIQLSNYQNISSAGYAATSAVAHKRRSFRRSFRCVRCGDAFTSKQGPRRHSLQRAQSEQHSCPVLGCSQKYKHPRLVKRHIRVAHAESR